MLQHQPNLDSSTPIAGMVLRKPFDAGLVTIATQAGAVFQERERGGEGHREPTARHGHARGRRYHRRPLCHRRGRRGKPHGTAARGIRRTPENIGASVLEEYPVAQQVMDRFFGDQRRLHVYLNASGIAGYGWVFPKKEHLNIGVGEFYQALGPRQPKHNLKTAYAQFLELLKTQKVIPEAIHALSPKGGVFPTHPQRRMYGDHSLLCGDAGGLTQPLTGEGIYYAMISGEIAGKTLVHALGTDQSTIQELALYQHSVDAGVRARLQAILPGLGTGKAQGKPSSKSLRRTLRSRPSASPCSPITL